MPPKRYYMFMIDDELREALRAAKRQTTELSEAAIIREALRDWFKKHRIPVKQPGRQRASTRQRSSTR